MPRKLPDPAVSVDQAIKELLQIRPPDTLAFLLPEVVTARGQPVSWQFHNVQVRKKDLSRKGYVMDLNIEFRFASGPGLLLILAEHWSTARSMDLLRTAQYFLDLKGRFPEHEIVPVALITEIDDHEVPDRLVARALGEDILSFRTHVVQLSRTDAGAWADVGNLVAQTLLMAMGGALSRLERLHRVIRFFQAHDEPETQLLFPLLTQVGRFNDEENNMTYKYLTQLPKPKFMVMLEEDAKAAGMAAGREQGLEQGKLASKLEDARKLVEHGVSWEIITSATGVKPEDLEAN